MLAFIAFEAFFQSDFLGKGVTLLILVAGIFALAIFFHKVSALRAFRSYRDAFLRFYKGQPHPLSPLFGEKALAIIAPTARIYKAGADKLLDILHNRGVSDDMIRAWQPNKKLPILQDTELEEIRTVCEQVLAEQTILVEKYMSLLATIVSSAPSLGLFGTVWGVMDAFMAMSTGGSSMISQVAPGISSALLTTVAGLVVAIPSSVGYNFLADAIRAHVVEMENFLDEFCLSVSRIHAIQAYEAPAGAAREPACPSVPFTRPDA